MAGPLEIGGLTAALLCAMPAARRTDAAGSVEGPSRPRHLAEDEARRIYAGFEGFVVDIGGPADTAAFVEHCRETGMTEFHGFPSVWREYEVYCVEYGAEPLPQGAFQRQFNRLAKRSRGRPIAGTVRPAVYRIPDTTRKRAA